MKTIEERAKEAYPAHEHTVLATAMKRDAYIRGAKEQKAIDEEVRLKKSYDMTQAEYDRETAFADWYLKNGKGSPTYSDAIEWSRKQTINEICNLLDKDLTYEDEMLTKEDCESVIYELRNLMWK